jgi:hypothetical protein
MTWIPWLYLFALLVTVALVWIGMHQTGQSREDRRVSRLMRRGRR